MKEDSEQALRCSVCEYIHRASEPPSFYPICGVPFDRFESIDEQEPAQQTSEGLRIMIRGGGIAGVSAGWLE